MRLYLAIIMCLGFLQSCVEPIDTLFIKNKNNFGVECFISPADSLLIASVVRNTPFSVNQININDIFVSDALVYISGNNKVIQLKYNPETRLYEAEHTNEFRIEAGGKYQLRIEMRNAEELKADCVVPKRALKADEIEVLKFKRSEKLMDIKLQWDKKQDEYFIMEPFYYLKLDTNSVFYDNTKSNVITRPFTKQFIESNSFTNDKVLTNFYTNDLEFFGTNNNTVFIKSTDANMYEYLKSAEQNFQNQVDPFSQPINVKGNISGGNNGCFGAFNGLRIDYEI